MSSYSNKRSRYAACLPLLRTRCRGGSGCALNSRRQPCPPPPRRHARSLTDVTGSRTAPPCRNTRGAIRVTQTKTVSAEMQTIQKVRLRSPRGWAERAAVGPRLWAAGGLVHSRPVWPRSASDMPACSRPTAVASGVPSCPGHSHASRSAARCLHRSQVLCVDDSPVTLKVREQMGVTRAF